MKPNKSKILLLWLILCSPLSAAWTERYVSVAGGGAHDGTSEANAFTLAEAITNSATAADGTRFNVKAGTYANTTTDRDFNGAGSTAGPLWWRGYNTTIGDIDGNNALAKPVITFTTGRFIASGTFQWFSNLDISGAQVTAGSGQIICSGADNVYSRIRSECTVASANGVAWRLTGVRTRVFGCWGKATTSAVVFSMPTGGQALLVGCHAEGGSSGYFCAAGNNIVIHCISDGAAGDGIDNSATWNTYVNCSIYNAGSDSIQVDSTTESANVVNTIADTSAAYHINASAGVSSNIFILNPAFRAPTTANLNQIFESQVWGSSVTETAIPFTDAPNDDFSLKSTALSKGTGFPGTFENESFSGFLDRGAVQREEAGGGGVIGGPNKNGNKQ